MLISRTRLLAALALCAVAPIWAGNIVLNPDFSVSGPYSLYSAIPDWTASTPSNSGSSNGDPFWDNGTVPAGISSVGFIQVNPRLIRMKAVGPFRPIHSARY